jgi:hypothetical protein
MDSWVSEEMIRLLDDPALVQAEIDRRREVARPANPLRQREEELRAKRGLVRFVELRHPGK